MIALLQACGTGYYSTWKPEDRAALTQSLSGHYDVLDSRNQGRYGLEVVSADISMSNQEAGFFKRGGNLVLTTVKGSHAKGTFGKCYPLSPPPGQQKELVASNENEGLDQLMKCSMSIPVYDPYDSVFLWISRASRDTLVKQNSHAFLIKDFDPMPIASGDYVFMISLRRAPFVYFVVHKSQTP